MQDRELVAAIVAGDPEGIAEAHDRYAAPLYTYCRSMLPDSLSPAEAVADTFIIATVKLAGLRDPDQLSSWLHAVARNECLRQLGPGGAAGAAGGGAGPAPPGVPPEIAPPGDLRERVLQDCTDNTPTGRAHRASVTHRAGPFGRTGFPQPVVPSGPRWRHEVRRHPRVAAGVAAVAAAVVAAGITALLISGGPHPVHASTVALGAGGFAASSAPPDLPGGRSSPSGKPRPASGRASTPASTADDPTAGKSTSPGALRSSAPTRSPSPSPSPCPSPSPSPSPSSSPPPTPGTLRVSPRVLDLNAAAGKPASGTFLVTAVGGPVHFVIGTANAKVTVSPSGGSLRSGSWATITVTVQSKVAFNARITVDPGNLIVTVRFTLKA